MDKREPDQGSEDRTGQDVFQARCLGTSEVELTLMSEEGRQSPQPHAPRSGVWSDG